ncbi:hypothetical protein JKP75_08230 [Blastococcus sp. TML/M2B]|uniref:hypothetical protein n=1 Tax=unclassified Blastococcus TaxID=2619396 RepID=UPI00190DA4CC|nr:MULTISPECIES: hypothetical protein [unclassified Blastococcus]MBN1092548.1 hypothetical protein [Blastococcus sp. TML/M2B]MBN1097357.1 hypothetical protein [Blastococcus sp. TML/C7B]
MDLADGVAVGLAARCLRERGRLRSFDIWDTAARGALLVDLVRAGRVVEQADAIEVQVAPTGFPPADRLLAAMEVEPQQPLTWWVDHGGVGMSDVADAAVTAHRWTVRRTLLGRRYAVGTPASHGEPESAVLDALATACGAAGRRPAEVDRRDLERAGPLLWICEAVVAHLQEAQWRSIRQAGAADGSGSPYY